MPSNLVLVGQGVLALLPRGRADPPVAGFQRQQQMRIARAGHAVGREVLLVLRIEIHVGAMRLVVEFAIMQQRDVGEDFLHIQRLAPAWMRHDQVGAEAVCNQGIAGSRYLQSVPYRRVEWR